MLENASVFNTLNSINVVSKVKEKNKLKYLPWASAWAEVKKKYPGATYGIVHKILDEYGNIRFWHDDGKTGWVSVWVTIEDITHTATLAIMDFKNKSIPAEEITSVDANKSMQRCLVKACAMHGLGLYIYEGEELPEETSKTIELIDEIKKLVEKKCSLSDKAKTRVAELCRNAEKTAFPDIDEEFITGNYKNIEDIDILSNLRRQLLTVRK